MWRFLKFLYKKLDDYILTEQEERIVLERLKEFNNKAKKYLKEEGLILKISEYTYNGNFDDVFKKFKSLNKFIKKKNKDKKYKKDIMFFLSEIPFVEDSIHDYLLEHIADAYSNLVGAENVITNRSIEIGYRARKNPTNKKTLYEIDLLVKNPENNLHLAGEVKSSYGNRKNSQAIRQIITDYVLLEMVLNYLEYKGFEIIGENKLLFKPYPDYVLASFTPYKKEDKKKLENSFKNNVLLKELKELHLLSRYTIGSKINRKLRKIIKEELY